MGKIAYIVSLKDSLESFIYREAECLINRGFDITFFSFFRDKGGDFSPSNLSTVCTPKLHNLIISSLLFFTLNPRNFFSLIQHALKYKSIKELVLAIYFSKEIINKNIETLQCHFGDRKFFVGYYCKRITNVNLNLTVHAHEIYANPNETLFKDALLLVDKIICISEKNKKLLIDRFGADEEKISVIRLSIDLDNFIKTDDVTVLTVARYTERKGFYELFQAIKNLDDLQDMKFVTVGWGDLDLAKMAEEFDINDRVTIFSKMNSSQLSFFYNNCQVFCLPSKTTDREGEEGIPVVLMEAMASEMVIVTTPNGSISELVDDILVSEGDVSSLEVGLRSAYSKIKKGNYPMIKNRTKVIDYYSDKNIDKLVEYLYE